MSATCTADLIYNPINLPIKTVDCMTMQHFSHLLQLWPCCPARKDVQLHYDILLTAQVVKNTTDVKYKGMKFVLLTEHRAL